MHHSAAGLYSKPQYFDYAHARKEFEVTCFTAIKDLLNKTGEKLQHALEAQHVNGTPVLMIRYSNISYNGSCAGSGWHGAAALLQQRHELQ